ncbi:hypothetical protein ACHWFS_26780, partial [Klebsiella pneumoniae]
MDLDQKQEPWISVNDKMPVVGVPVHCQLKGCWSGKIVEYDLRHCCKVSDEAAFCLIQRPYISKTLLT